MKNNKKNEYWGWIETCGIFVLSGIYNGPWCYKIQHMQHIFFYDVHDEDSYTRWCITIKRKRQSMNFHSDQI
jgi:hypothetical protein